MSNIYIAKGDTYPHREAFTSWAWHWDCKRRAWIEDNGSEKDEPCIQFAMGLPSVVVTIEAVDDGMENIHV